MERYFRIVVLCLGVTCVSDCLAGRASLISSNYTGQTTASGASDQFAVTPDGRYIVFRSNGSDLETSDTNSSPDLYLLDRASGLRRCITAGHPTFRQYTIDQPTITPDGRWIAFRSDHTNLTSGITNVRANNIFVYDAVAGNFSLGHAGQVDSPDGASNPALSEDGRYLSFQHSYRSSFTIYRWDRLSGQVEAVGADTNQVPNAVWRVTPGGRYYAFVSRMPNVVVEVESTNGIPQVYWRDMETRETKLVSVTGDGGFCEAAGFVRALSRDGRYVAFKTTSTNVVSGVRDWPGDDLFVRDTVSNTTWCVTMHTSGTNTAGSGDIVREASFSADATKLIFLSAAGRIASNLNVGNPYGVYLHDMVARTNWAIGLAGIAQGTGDGILELSDNGRFAAFLHNADLMACDAWTGRVRKVGQRPSLSLRVTTRMTGNGAAVFFVSGQNEAPATGDANGLAGDVFVAPTMPLEILDLSVPTAAARIVAAGLPGDPVRVQRSTDLSAWEDIGSGTLGPDATSIIEDTRQQTIRRFYRLVSP